MSVARLPVHPHEGATVELRIPTRLNPSAIHKGWVIRSYGNGNYKIGYHVRGWAYSVDVPRTSFNLIVLGLHGEILARESDDHVIEAYNNERIAAHDNSLDEQGII